MTRRTRRGPALPTPEELRHLAHALGCRTQRDLADVLGITQARVSQILSGAYPLRPGPLVTLIRELQVKHRRARRTRR